ncbi:efflux RND transporter permease subunit [Ectothiorhodospiraceae bacterium BW-2]|nr:efflux RND transporter permease subunit [Ectothiorhodospiraceae bacterium BW-2]
MSSIAFAIDRPLLVNLLLLLVGVAGLMAWQKLPQEMFPTTEQPRVQITTLFAGASPEEVERQITIPLESAFNGQSDIESLTSISSEGLSRLTLELTSESDIDEFVRDAEAILSRLDDLPAAAELPRLQRQQTRFPVISVALYGGVARHTLFEYAEWVEQQLAQLPDVAAVEASGLRQNEIWLEADPYQLAQFGISLTEIKQAVVAAVADLPGGRIESREGDILLRGLGTGADIEAIGAIAVRHGEEGRYLRLDQLLKLSLRQEQATTLGRYNGYPSVNLTLTKTESGSTIEVAAAVYRTLQQLRQQLPLTIQVGTFSDLSVYVKNRLDTVKASGVVGLVLVLLSLWLFLNGQVALVTAVGIPIAFLVAILLLWLSGFSINMVSLFAFLIALGLVVDDAIIVTENIYRHLESGLDHRTAAVVGATELFWPVMASAATTIAAFLPMLTVSGTMGAFIAVIPAVVIFALLGSLWESFWVLPSHAKEWIRSVPNRSGQERRWLMRRYLALLKWGLLNRYLVLVTTIALLLLALLFAATRLPFQLFGTVSTGQFFVNIEAPLNYSLSDSERLAAKIEQQIMAELDQSELASLLTNVGVTFVGFNTMQFGSNQIQIIIDLKPQRAEGVVERWIAPLLNLQWQPPTGERVRTAEEVIGAIRQRLQPLSAIESLAVVRTSSGPAGADIEIGLSGSGDLPLQPLANELRDYIATLVGTSDVSHNLRQGKQELTYRLNERGRQLGLTQQQLASMVRAAFQGEEVVRVNHQGERIALRLLYAETYRQQFDALARLPLTLADGRVLFLGDVATVVATRGLSDITRRNATRMVTLTAEVDSEVATPLQVTEQIERYVETLQQRHPDLKVEWLGEKRAAGESMRDMGLALLIALLLIFVILTALFNSLLDSLVVMVAIPFGMIGVVMGHWLLDLNLQFLSMIGFLALAGIVVNDSLILIDFVNRYRREGHPRFEALLEAGRIRARPIILTSMTTFLGVSPLIFFATDQTAFLTPMAVSLGFGLLVSTVLILFTLPCLYLIGDDLRLQCNREGLRFKRRRVV